MQCFLHSGVRREYKDVVFTFKNHVEKLKYGQFAFTYYDPYIVENKYVKSR